MKHFAFAVLLGSATILQSFGTFSAAEAAVLKNVSEYAGQRCNTPPRGSGVIVGIFSGVKESPFISDDDARVPVDRFRCFTSMDECRGWLYTMQSKYDAGAPRAVSCRRR
ncbi:metallophosphoesterase [Phyllobacterium salinisoli]|uniref:metallophosphoesterase n=1 Tax=Phyllobacterium salinisoli TaxID=1899321 RepID=UPI0026BEDEF6